MAKSLGERIKHLRKELKMTQTDLAGTEMTKSMLSQIENNTAMPSMKNLQYLASKLNKPISYFLDDGAYQTSLPIEAINEELKDISNLINNRKPDEALLKLETMQSKYNFDCDSKIYADFLSKYGNCLIELNNYDAGEDKIKEAVDIYKDKFSFIEAAKAYLILIAIPWNEFNYEKCMSILEQALEIYNNSLNKDYAFEIRALHIRSILNAGLDNIEDCIAAASKAISISKQTDIYFNSDQLYKTLAVMNGFLGNFEEFDNNIEKAKQFAVFTDNTSVLASIEGVCGLYKNQLGQPEAALEHLEKALQISPDIAAFAYTEKAKSLFMLSKYQQVLDTLKLIQYPSFTPFKYDFLHIWSSKIYEGLTLMKMAKFEEAIAAITLGIEKMEIVGVSKNLAFAYKSLSEVFSGKGDFEKAFAALKKSNELDVIAKENRLYY